MWVHQLTDDRTKTIYRGNCLKKGLRQFAGYKAKNMGGVFEGRGGGRWYPNARYDLILVHDGTWGRTCWCEQVEFWSIFPAV